MTLPTLKFSENGRQISAHLSMDGRWECADVKLLDQLRKYNQLATWRGEKHPVRMCIEHAAWQYNCDGVTTEVVLGPDLSILEIIRKNEAIQQFWSTSHGWAPRDAAEKLAAARLDRQVALSRTLPMWLAGESGSLDEGQLILAWANLGSLVEGTLKWFLTVFDSDYQNGPHVRHAKPVGADELFLEEARVFFKRIVWVKSERKEWDAFILHIQQRRNSIHAYRDRPIGTYAEWAQYVERYLRFVEVLDGRVPYPDHL